MALAKVFDSLPTPSQPSSLPSFSTAVIPGGAHRLGKDSSSAAALLIATRYPTPQGKRPVPLELEHLVVQYDVTCLVWDTEDSKEEATFTLIRCREPDRVLTSYFLEVIDAVIPLLGSSPSEANVREVVTRLAELFRALQMPSRKTVQGLWAELFVIAHGTEPAELVKAWHAAPGEPFDFSHLAQRLEIKSASGPERQHHFSLEQVSPGVETTVLVASLFAKRAGGGVSVAQLAAKARSRLKGDPDLILRVEQVVATSLGQDWRLGLEDSFDLERAVESLAFFWAQSIPSVDRKFPSTVSEVRFRSDLTAVTPVDARAVHDAGGIFRAALPLGAGRRA